MSKAESATESKSDATSDSKGGGRFRVHDPLTQLVLTIPVFLTYHLGILFLDIRNGVDFASVFFWQLLRTTTAGYVAATLLICAGLLGAAAYLHKKHKIRPVAFGPLLLESTLLAFGMLISVGWLTEQVLAVPPLAAGMDLSPFAKVVLSCGAGFHEELVFRVVVFGGLLWFADRHIARKWLAVIVAALVSSLLFSAIHYIGALSDPFTLSSFVFRAIAGLYLTAVYRLRGFAVAVYTHAIYDIFVMFFFGA